ncbi:MAG TPA: ATP-binding cassette domain-containing protein [Candidatus Nanopelagicales bacterium]|jgi:ABC-2 type transport system ATP-binding protein
MTAPAVLIDHVSHRYGDHLAVDDVSMEVAPGEVFGLLGPNGAGKTTTILLLTTLLTLQSGRMQVLGRDVTRQRRDVRRGLGYVPQMLSADAGLTGRENVALFARLYDVPRQQRRDRVAEVLDAVGLDDAADQLASRYSGGMIRRLEVAQALVNRPLLLVLDEPTIGLDPVARDSVWDLLTELRTSVGTTVLVTTHYMQEAESHCHRVALMHHGQVRAMDTPQRLTADIGTHATLEDVFRHYTGDSLEEGADKGGYRAARSVRRTARRLG